MYCVDATLPRREHRDKDASAKDFNRGSLEKVQVVSIASIHSKLISILYHALIQHKNCRLPLEFLLEFCIFLIL